MTPPSKEYCHVQPEGVADIAGTVTVMVTVLPSHAATADVITGTSCIVITAGAYSCSTRTSHTKV
ncbi:MAG: hypothetical protein IPL08_10455 [Saprospiraceae bacterium]|nr:hypothetical protein [Saprospiraceae bacterium]